MKIVHSAWKWEGLWIYWNCKTVTWCLDQHCCLHDDVIKWNHFPRYWPFVREIHRSLVDYPHKGQWRRALMFSLIWALTNCWANNQYASDLRCHCTLWRHCNDCSNGLGSSLVLTRLNSRACHQRLSIIQSDDPSFSLVGTRKLEVQCT